jgi:GTP-binding protein
MFITSAQFITSASTVQQCPPPLYPEIAFFGRSNVGKSSLINTLTQRNNLAKASNTP